MNIRPVLATSLVLSLAAVACGGDAKPAQSPESNAGIIETSAKEDMPPPPATEGDTSQATSDEKAAGPGAGGGMLTLSAAGGGMLTLSAMKLAPVKKGKNDKSIEVKDDGTVLIDGKPAATIKGDEVTSTGGTSMVTIGVDGSLVGNGVQPGYKFEGDDLVHESGVKLSVGDDGTVSASKDGKSEVIVKTEGSATSAKRAALVAAVLWMTIPTTLADAGKGAKKPDAKQLRK